ncbi:MAG: CvpA family protein [Dysgonamonadaceae bacterium]|jgi:membrane protein required for colicin V production|nr:CvpA family protein [Dysgonamonadaceae bacterium]
MNWLDIVIIVCIAIGLIKGLFEGFIKQAVSFLALIAAIFFSGQLAVFLRNFSRQLDVFSSMNQALLSAICYIFAFVLIIIVIVLLGRIVHIAIKMTPAKWLNVLLGGLFGALIWLFSLSIVFNLLYIFDFQSGIIKKETQEKSIFYENVKSVVPTVYPFIREYFKKQTT